MEHTLRNLAHRRRARFCLPVLSVTLALVGLLWLASLGGSWAAPPEQAGTGCLHGHVQLEACPPNGETIPECCRPFTVYVESCGKTIPPCTVPPCAATVPVDAQGWFTVCQLLSGSHDIVVRGYNTLANLRTGINVPVGTIPVDFGTLRPGDASGNNAVDILDYSILATAYGTSKDGPGWDRRADFNCTCHIEILDYSWLATYYAEQGATCP